MRPRGERVGKHQGGRRAEAGRSGREEKGGGDRRPPGHARGRVSSLRSQPAKRAAGHYCRSLVRVYLARESFYCTLCRHEGARSSAPELLRGLLRVRRLLGLVGLGQPLGGRLGPLLANTRETGKVRLGLVRLACRRAGGRSRESHQKSVCRPRGQMSRARVAARTGSMLGGVPLGSSLLLGCFAVTEGGA